MSEEEVGIENMKELVGSALDLAHAIKVAAKKGPTSPAAMGAYMRLASGMPAAVDDAALVVKEYADFSDAEVHEMEVYVGERLDDVAADKVKVIVQDAVAAALHLAKLGSNFVDQPES